MTLTSEHDLDRVQMNQHVSVKDRNKQDRTDCSTGTTKLVDKSKMTVIVYAFERVKLQTVIAGSFYYRPTAFFHRSGRVLISGVPSYRFLRQRT